MTSPWMSLRKSHGPIFLFVCFSQSRVETVGCTPSRARRQSLSLFWMRMIMRQSSCSALCTSASKRTSPLESSTRPRPPIPTAVQMAPSHTRSMLVRGFILRLHEPKNERIFTFDSQVFSEYPCNLCVCICVLILTSEFSFYSI